MTPPASTQDVLDRYRTPETRETPGTKRKRRNNRAAAKYRLKVKRKLQEEERLEEVHQQNAQRQADRRASSTPEELEIIRSQERERRATQRESLSAEDAQMIRERDAESHRQQREAQTSQLVYVALQHHEGYSESTLNGKHVCDGRHKLPRMIKTCKHCKALKFPGETDGACCYNGKYSLLSIEMPPQELIELFEKRDFMPHIRKYNSVFSFTSMGVSVDQTLANGKDGVYTYRINGELCHKIGSLLPMENSSPKFAQICV